MHLTNCAWITKAVFNVLYETTHTKAENARLLTPNTSSPKMAAIVTFCRQVINQINYARKLFASVMLCLQQVSSGLLI